MATFKKDEFHKYIKSRKLAQISMIIIPVNVNGLNISIKRQNGRVDNKIEFRILCNKHIRTIQITTKQRFGSKG